jgi:hypothetical protein
VLCVDGTTGAFRWAAGTETDAFGAPAFGDLDGDGISELVFGRQAFGADGSLLWVGAGGAGRHSSFVSDLDMDGRAEVIAGNTRYAADGTTLWTSTSPEGVVAQDGTAATGDFDGDGRGDVVHVGGGVLHLKSRLPETGPPLRVQHGLTNHQGFVSTDVTASAIDGLGERVERISADIVVIARRGGRDIGAQLRFGLGPTLTPCSGCSPGSAQGRVVVEREAPGVQQSQGSSWRQQTFVGRARYSIGQ